MNFSLYLIGNPNRFLEYPIDSYSHQYQQFLNESNSESQIVVCRNEKLVRYVYFRQLPGQKGVFFGFVLVVTGVYCGHHKWLYDFFDNAYYDVLLKGRLLGFEKNRYRYRIENFVEDIDEFKRIETYFRERINQSLGNSFLTIPTTCQIGRGECTLSIEDDEVDVNAAVLKYDIVHVTNNAKSVSELELMQRMLSDMYSKHQKLEAEYKKVLNQKRNFKLVAVLSLIVISCAVGFFLLYDLLNVRDSTIKDLKVEIASKNEAVVECKMQNNSLSEQVSQYKKVIVELNQNVKRKNDSIARILSENREFSDDLLFCQDQVLSLRAENLALSKKGSSTSGNTYETYEVYASGGDKAYCYYLCGTNYIKTDCYYSDFQKVTVYLKKDGYALTPGGYVRMMDIRK